METPWKGKARPVTGNAFAYAAQRIGCEEAALRAVWQVEAAGRFYLADGTVVRRFEPHKMPGSKLTWRDSLKFSPPDREALFVEAWRQSPEAACRASSWAAPQIMGFNAEAAGYGSAVEMVADMSDSADAQLTAFVRLVTSWGLDSALRAHDWLTFARRYNGSGQPEIYARKIEAAYRNFSGKKSPAVLHAGARGAAVRRLQVALGIDVDGAFGPATSDAVRAFQRQNGLPEDGIVGRRTWEALEVRRDTVPVVQPTRRDQVAEKAIDVAIKGGGGFLAGGTLQELLPDGALQLLAYGGVIIALVLGGLIAYRWARASA